jgi:hypothetical protein
MLEIVYKDRDNTIDFRLKANTVLDPELKIIDLTDITRMVLAREDGFLVDSAKEDNIFNWMTLATSGIVSIQLGHLNLKNGQDFWRLIVYDATNTKGLVWGKKPFKIDVRQKYNVIL